MIFIGCLLALLFGGTLANHNQCQQTDECDCYSENENSQYNCPSDPHFTIHVLNGEAVEINCLERTLDWDDESSVPNLNGGILELLKLEYCPIPKNFATFINRLGINSTKTLDVSSLIEENTLNENNFNGLLNLDKLILSNSRLKYIDDDTFKSLENLTDLHLESNDLESLQPNTFKRLKKLKKLNLSANKLASLSETIFEDLALVDTLYLFRNNLKSISSATLRSAKSLSLLELSYNKIENLPEDLFVGLRNFKRLSLVGNRLTEIPTKTFTNAPNLELIKLSDNPLGAVPNLLFSNLVNLKEVHLENCSLVNLPNGLFDGSTNVETISLAYNKLEIISEGLLDNLKVLKNLDLSFNAFKQLTSSSFESLGQLRVLNLQNNFLSDLGEKTFDKLYKLEILYLNNNFVANILYPLFDNLQRLKEIYLANNLLVDSDASDSFGSSVFHRQDSFKTNLELEIIDLRNNSISVLTEDLILNKVKLRRLDLSYNKIKSVSIATLITASGIPKTVNLEHNNISVVYFQEANLQQEYNYPSSSYANAQTTVLLNYNPINCQCNIYDLTRYVDKTIDPIVLTLVEIEVDNLICASPKELFNVPVKRLKSKTITCSLDQLSPLQTCTKECDCEFRLWDESLIVDCSYRNLTVVPKLVAPKQRFYTNNEVYLQNNLLKEGPNENMGYENVTTLVMSFNDIDELMWIPPDTRVLRLDNNNISYLSQKFVSKLKSSHITNLTLGSNPLICDCSATDLLTYLVSHLPTVQIDANRIYCRDKESILISLNVYDLCPVSQLNVYVLSAVSIILIIIVCICVVLYYRNEHEIKVWLFAHNMCLWFVTEEEVDKNKIYDAFISYSHKDEDFVINELQSVLEAGPKPYKLCIHTRDWMPGESIPKQIVKSVEESRRTLVILSPHFLESVWATMEFRTAHTQAMSEGRARVIVILYGDLDLDAHLDDELKAYIKTNTYVKWNDPWFWDKLRYALPHSQKDADKRKSQKNQNLMIALNDKLGLTAPTVPNFETTPPVMSADCLVLKGQPISFPSAPALTSSLDSSLNQLLVKSHK